MLRYCASILILAVFISCENDINLINEFNRKKGNEEFVENVTMQYTDSGKLMVLLRAPLIKRTIQNNSAYQEFPKGIYCEFYDDSTHIKATLTAKYAIRDENKRVMTARNQVHLVSAVDSTHLEGEELIWDENRQLIYSNKFVKWTRGKEVGTGFFFEADQSFKKIKMRQTEADNIVLPGLQGLQN
ncbi:MAG: LPS export ABC transporter periplasmic protein LptC [Saprospiraceae bacterium]|nr:LPS export ABC transporter periplasmic protein LptC [Saprospiraceae bacterium]